MEQGQPSQIGRYKIVGELGCGGFGRVYRGYDPTVGRPVAIKILTQVSEDNRTRFRNEAVVAGNLGHRNIVTVYEYGTHGDLPFLAMEYLEGQDLHQLIASHKSLSLLKKCTIMSEVAEGLHCAHQSGVVHRDMKPGNIMVLTDGTVKIMDFGIARLTTGPDATRLTQQGYLIGTLRYMAPEQLAGSDFDALCDIFAYGVVFYELLAARHPFETPDAQNLMYKLAFEEPPPIRNFAPDVPEALQDVISRIMHKDRARRYQSLRDVQFDIEPIRIDLQKGHVSALLSQAQDLIGRNEVEPAQSVVHEALALDPSNQTARTLREELKQRLQRRASQGRIEHSMRAGEEHLAQRRFTDAVHTFEQALVVDPGNGTVQARIEHARGMAEHARRASQLLVEARKELEERNVTAAYRSVSMALRHDPKNPDAAEFLKTIQAYIEGRQAEQRVDDIIRKAQGLMLIPDYDEAVATLISAGPDAESPRIVAFLERVRTEKLAHERKQRVRKEIAQATDQLRDRRIEEAVQRLENLHREFPDDHEVSQLLAYAHKERGALARAKAVERVASEARARAESHDFEGALAALDRALQEHSGDSILIRLLSSTLAAKDAWERQQAIEAAGANGESLRSRRQYAEAVRSLEAALEEFAAEPVLLNLLRQIQAEWAEQRRNEAIRQVCAQAEVLLSQGRPEAAVRMIEQALERHAGDATLGELLQRTQNAVQAQQKTRALGAIGSEAARRAAVKEFDAALSILDRGLETWQDAPELVRQRSEILAAKLAWEQQAQRAAAIDKLGREAKVRADAGDLEGALALLDRGLQTWPDAPSLREIRETTLVRSESRRKRDRALQELEEIRTASLRVSDSADQAKLLSLAVSIASQYAGDEEIQDAATGPIASLSDIGRARKEVMDGRFQAAMDISEGYLAQHPDHAAFVELKREAQRAQRRARVNEYYQRATAEPDLQKRAAILQEVLQHHPQEPAIEDELRLTRNRLALIDSIVEKARAYEESGLWAEALEQWSSILTIYDRYPGLNEHIEHARRAQQEAKFHANDPYGAAELLRKAQTEYPDSSRLREAAVQLQQIADCKTQAAEAEMNQGWAESSNLAPASLAGSEPQSRLRERKLLLALIGAGVALSGGILITGALRRPGEIAVNIAANVQGASVSVGGKSCVTPNCALELTPGSYALLVNANGYQAIDKQFTIEPRQAPMSLQLALEPLPQLVQVNTDFEEGQVYIDGRLDGMLRDRRYTVSGMTPGRHTIRVTGSGASFEGEWRIVAGAAPELLRLSANKDVAAIIVASAGATGSLVCNCVSQPVTVDGAPMTMTSASAGTPVELKGLKQGKQQIAIGERSLVLDIGANPMLNVALSLDRNASLVPPEPQTLAVRKGGKKLAAFQPAPEQTYLEVSGSAAGSQVRLDGQEIGETDRNGDIRRAVTPGDHNIEFTKEGYVPLRLAGKFLSGKVLHLGRPQVAMVKAVKTMPLDPAQVEAQDWARIANSTSQDDFEAFARSHPGGAHAEQARNHAAELHQLSQANGVRQAEQTAWTKVDKNKRDDLQDYLSRFPAGVHAQEARNRIAEVDRQSAEALAVQRLRKDKDAERAKNAAEEQAVVSVLKEFESAYNRKDLAALQQFWDGVPTAAYRQQFREATSLKFQLQVIGQPTLNGNSAMATCVRTLTYQGRSGPPQTHSERVNVTLSRESSGWRIRSIKAN